MKRKLPFLIVLLIAALGVKAQIITTVSDATVCSGATTVDVPVKVTEFNAVGSITLRLTYTTSELSSPSVVYQDEGLITWGTFMTNYTTPGTIIISAYDPDAIPPFVGLTLADNTILFTLRFTIETITATSEINFIENAQGTWCEYSGIGPTYTVFEDTPQNLYYIDGSVSIDDTPVSPTLNAANPASGTVICSGYNSGIATFNGGSGGGDDEYEYSIDGGGNWLSYTNGAAINTSAGAGSVQVRARRSGGACSPSDYNTYTIWTFGTSPVSPVLNNASPAGGTSFCAGYNTATVTCDAGSGGSTGAADEYQVSIDGGSNWNTYTNGAAINTDEASGSVIVQARRTGGNYGCSESAWSTICTWTINAKQKISGVFYYYNSSGDILLDDGDISIDLYKSSDLGHTALIGSTATNEAGYFEFTSLCPDCDYDIVATSTHSTDGAVNTTDAAFTNYWGPNPFPIEKVRFHAGNVAGTVPFVSATDAAKIQQHFVNGASFDSDPWTFWKAGTTISQNPDVNDPEYTEYFPKVTLNVGSDATVDMYGLVSGDFNRSFDPTLSKYMPASVELLHSGNMVAKTGEEITLPVYIADAAEISAVSLVLDFKASLAAIEDVIMNADGGQLVWAANGNELRISWLSQVPLLLDENDVLLTIVLKTSEEFTRGNSIELSLAGNPLNELAGKNYNVIPNTILTIAVVDAGINGIDGNPGTKNFAVNCYPNPFSRYTYFAYTLPFNGQVQLEVINMLGVPVAEIVNETQDSGDYLTRFSTEELPGGIYTAILRLKSSGNEIIKTIKLINNQ